MTITAAVDTSAFWLSMALLDGETLLSEYTGRPARSHSVSILPILDELLGRHGMTPKDLGLLAVGVGPGSFTGLRIGMATWKGLAWSLGVPLVGESSLEAMSLGVLTATDRLVVPILDARKGEVFAAVHRRSDELGVTRVRDEGLFTPEGLGALLDELDPEDHAVLLGDGAHTYREQVSRGRLVLHAEQGRAEARYIGILGHRRLAAEGAADLASLAPRYLRKSEAEIGLETRKKSTPAPTVQP